MPGQAGTGICAHSTAASHGANRTAEAGRRTTGSVRPTTKLVVDFAFAVAFVATGFVNVVFVAVVFVAVVFVAVVFVAVVFVAIDMAAVVAPVVGETSQPDIPATSAIVATPALVLVLALVLRPFDKLTRRD